MLIAAIGNPFRCDDGVALRVTDAVRADLPATARVTHAADVLSLVDQFRTEEQVVLIDAVRSGAAPGTVHEIDATNPLSAEFSTTTSTHGLGLPHAIELARRLDRLPAQLIVIGIEGCRFDDGTELSPAVEAAIPRAAAIIRRLASVSR